MLFFNGHIIKNMDSKTPRFKGQIYVLSTGNNSLYTFFGNLVLFPLVVN